MSGAAESRALPDPVCQGETPALHCFSAGCEAVPFPKLSMRSVLVSGAGELIPAEGASTDVGATRYPPAEQCQASENSPGSQGDRAKEIEHDHLQIHPPQYDAISRRGDSYLLSRTTSDK